MPELPEVETVRRTLLGRVVGQKVARLTLRRRDVVRGDVRLLRRPGRIVGIERRGKQLALAFDDGRRVCVHLGMTGSLTWTHNAPARSRLHEHVVWRFESGGAVVFRDPRRFGGVWVFEDAEQLHAQRWSKLGPDALSVTAAQLRGALAGKRQALKAALMDQHAVAGLGNIYVDEALFACGLWPTTPADDLSAAQVKCLAAQVRKTLQRAIRAGGSSLRDYVDGNGRRGGFQKRHKVYGRSGEPCMMCEAALASFLVAGRTTVACPTCQPTPATN